MRCLVNRALAVVADPPGVFDFGRPREFMTVYRCADPTTLRKPGVEWSEIRGQLETLDMIQFRGTDWFSRAMVRAELQTLGQDAARFTHAALVIWGSDFPKTSKFHSDTKLYVFECTDCKQDAVPNFDGKKFMGVQLRDLDEVVPNYDCCKETELAWMRMHDDARPNVDPEALERVVNKYLNRKFEMNPVYLLSALYTGLRPWRTLIGRGHGSKRLFCSELVTHVLQDLEVIDPDVSPLDVLPADFRSPDQTHTMDPDGAVPVLFDEAKTFTAFPLD